MSGGELAAAAAAAPPAARTLPAWLVPPGRFFFKHRNWVFPVAFLLLAGFGFPAPFLGNLAADRWLDAIGILLALGGQVLRAAVIGLAYIVRGGLNKKVHADTLVTAGLFAHSRNPLYLGNLLGIFGLLLVLNSKLGYLVGVPFFLFAYLAITAAEEDFLRARFGAEYDEYCHRVPRFRLRLAGLAATLRSMAFDWRRLLRKEYGSTFSGATAIMGLLLWEAWRQGGREALAGRAAWLAPVWGALTVLYLLARWLKKSGRLGRG
jgi:protein-S-isoprenylcysteine O-methyltransferase Ste14